MSKPVESSLSKIDAKAARRLKKPQEDSRVAKGMWKVRELYITENLHLETLEVTDELCERAGLTAELAEEFDYASWVPSVLSAIRMMNWDYHRQTNHLKFMQGYQSSLEESAKKLGETAAMKAASLVEKNYGLLNELFEQIVPALFARLPEMTVKEQLSVLKDGMSWVSKQQELQLKVMLAKLDENPKGGATPEMQKLIDILKERGALATIITGLGSEDIMSASQFLDTEAERARELNEMEEAISRDVSVRTKSVEEG